MARVVDQGRLTLLVDDATREFAYDAIERLESRRTYRHWKRGFLIGSGVGVIAWGISGLLEDSSSSENDNPLATDLVYIHPAVGIALNGALGALVGALFTGEAWETISVSPAVGMAAAGRTVKIGVRVRF